MMNGQRISSAISLKRRQESEEAAKMQQSIIIARGEAAVLNGDGRPISYPDSILEGHGMVLPHRTVDPSRIQGILVNSGIIRFEENRAFLNFVIQESRNRTVMSQLGRVAEAVIVKRCSESEDTHYELFCIAAGKKAHKKTAKQFEAIGTGLLDTRTSHGSHYNSGDTQRDIIFVNKAHKPALMSNATLLAGQCAGLQVKTSNDMVSYILSDIVTVRYCVPIVCVPVIDYSASVWISRDWNGKENLTVINIYDELIRRITGNKNCINRLIEKNQDYFGDSLGTKDKVESRLYEYLKSRVYDLRDIDKAAFDEVMFMKDLLEELAYGRLSPDDLMRKSETLKSYLLSFGLWMEIPHMENNNIYVPDFHI